MFRPVLAVLTMATAIPAVAQQPSPVTQAPILSDATLLDVVATGKAQRVPDIATIRAGVVTQAPTAAAALSENAQRMARVLAALRRAGVAERDLQTATVQLQPQYRYAENQPPAITGYQTTNTVAVRFRDVGKSGTILDTLVAQGANQIEGPTLSVDAEDAATDEARTDAVRRARARAELYARAAGLRVERILTIAEGSEQMAPPPVALRGVRVQSMAAESTQVAAGEQEIAATVAVRFLLR